MEKEKRLVKVLGEHWTEETIAKYPAEYLEYLKKIIAHAKLNSINVEEIENEYNRVIDMYFSSSNKKGR